MYYRSAKRVLRKFLAAAKQIIIRSYFADSNFRIIRAQSAQNNDSVDVDELDVFSDSGDILVGDFWNIYGFTYIERLVASIEPRAKVRVARGPQQGRVHDSGVRPGCRQARRNAGRRRLRDQLPAAAAVGNTRRNRRLTRQLYECPWHTSKCNGP